MRITIIFLFLSAANCKFKTKLDPNNLKIIKYVQNAAIQSLTLASLYCATWIIKIIFVFMDGNFAQAGYLFMPPKDDSINRKALFVHFCRLLEYIFDNASMYIEIKLKESISSYAAKQAISACCNKRFRYLDGCNKTKLIQCVLSFPESVADVCIQEIKFYGNVLKLIAILLSYIDSIDSIKSNIIAILCTCFYVLVHYLAPSYTSDFRKKTDKDSIVEDLIDNMKMVSLFGEKDKEEIVLLKICELENNRRVRVDFWSQFLENLRLLTILNGLISAYLLLASKTTEAASWTQWFSKQAYIYYKFTAALTNMAQSRFSRNLAYAEISRGLSTLLEANQKEDRSPPLLQERRNCELIVHIGKPFRYND